MIARIRYPLALASCALLSVIPSSAQDQPPDLIRYQAGLVQPSVNAVAARPVDVELDAVREATRLRVELPDGPVVVAERDGLERRSDTDLTWRGRLTDEPDSRVVLTLKNGHLVASLRGQLGLYEIRPLADGGHVFEKLDPESFPECGGGILPPDSMLDASLPPRTGSEASDPADDIHLMSVYTPQARSAAGGASQIEATIQAAVDNANTSFIDSDMIARYNLVHTAEAAYNDTGNLSSDLSWLANDATVASLRNQHAADMVSLIVENGGSGCGIGYVQRNPGPSFASVAFQVTDRGCAVGNLTFAHEHGHNMGFEHDPANGTTPSNASYPWSFGHFVNGSYRTVMSYSNQCTLGCTRVAHHSNPDILHAGAPTGIANERDNARSGDLIAPIVADFRLGSSAVCGNGIIEGSEECDGADLGGASCTAMGCTGGTPTCTGSCTLDYSSCTGCPQCDNDGTCDPGEDCNGCGDCPGGMSTGAVCGNGLCEAGDGEDCVSCPSDCAGKQNGKPSGRFCCGFGGSNPVGCSDARCTSNGFSCTEQGSPPVAYCCGDPTCTTAVEDACSCPECGPPPPGEFLCGDGLDDDCDGLIDCDDPDCDTDPVCDTSCSPVGASCSESFECCSGKCRGKSGNKTCKG